MTTEPESNAMEQSLSTRSNRANPCLKPGCSLPNAEIFDGTSKANVRLLSCQDSIQCYRRVASNTTSFQSALTPSSRLTVDMMHERNGREEDALPIL